jgi:Pin2-interacting protein X1
MTRRVKWSHDPNNTKWTRDTGGFGHKIMTAQGWQPGDILGAKNASYAELHTAANASHIRVFMKDDNLGLGAKRSSGLAEGECTGLDVFQSLLGRLNGKDEDELVKEQNSREDLKRAIYTERRWGSVRFVRGGFLIGDKIQELVDQKERIRQLVQQSSSAISEVSESDLSENPTLQTSKTLVVKDKKAKKKRRKAQKEQDDSPEITAVSKIKPNKTYSSTQDIPQGTQPTKPRKSKKRRKPSEDATEDSSTVVPEHQDVSGKSKKKKRRDEGTESKEGIEDGTTAEQASKSQPLASTSGSNTPQSLLGGRHAVRSRNIAQKRLAVLDTASLNQVSGQVTSLNEFEILIAC